jgi:hypothetical protein
VNVGSSRGRPVYTNDGNSLFALVPTDNDITVKCLKQSQHMNKNGKEVDVHRLKGHVQSITSCVYRPRFQQVNLNT